MQKRKLSRDINVRAAQIVALSTGQPMPGADKALPSKPEKEKNPAAVALGRLGGLKGGKARAEKLSAKRRKEIGQKAAAVRWRNL